MEAVVFLGVLLFALLIQQSQAGKEGQDATIRLIGGATRCSGQVQINIQDTWFSVCRTNWDEPEGQVVCRQLGCGSLVSPYANYKDKAPSHPVWNDMVSCVGDEASLLNCSRQGNGTHDLCPETYRAAVACHQDGGPNLPDPMSIRLVNGTTAYSGRVEIYYNGEWGTVCGQNSWSHTDGQVVCHQLGYSDVVGVRDHYDPFGVGNGTIMLSYVDCDGSEDFLGNCSHQGWYKHNCDHYYDVGVICKMMQSEASMVRLMDGTSQYNGRVEVYYNGEWGTVCDDGWNLNDAQVVCRQLGLGPAVSIGGPYGRGKGPILLSDVACEGTETSISDCDQPGWYPQTSCHHREDAGVICGVPEDPTVTVRLVQGGQESLGMGMVEAYHNGEWGAVCGKTFSILEADVVCGQLGFRKALEVKEPGFYGDGDFIILSGVQCTEDVKQLEDCQLTEWYPAHSVCTSHDTAGLRCDVESKPITVVSVDVRLTGSPSHKEGQVEVYHDGLWGTICVTGFDMHAANVVCKQLGFYAARYIPSDGRFSDGRKPILLDKLPCRTGTEESVANCVPLEWYRHDWHNCKPEETAAVVCYGSMIDSELDIVIRLNNGSKVSNGRVEVYHHSIWGSVCGAGLTQNEAQVACRQLGYKEGQVVQETGYYGSGTGDISMWAFSCVGTELLVQDCATIEWYDASKHVCDEKKTAGIVCSTGDSETSSSTSKKSQLAIMLALLLAIMALVLSAVAGYCLFVRRSRRTEAATQMRYAVLDRQDNSSAY
ncbi:scavenger receptor cysteine-rich domain-containing protein DMBT1-like [Asterias amurensis]|uniref:scavenger receptor cysteine-rich domain-containing protein DMBT1-like n=1 Tax=Asterias amurensis TaxID=7602 RepID=UPI003AB20BA9